MSPNRKISLHYETNGHKVLMSPKSGAKRPVGPDLVDIRKNFMLKDRKYFVTLGFFCEH